MKALVEFIRTTLVGGLLVLLPVYLLLLVLLKMISSGVQLIAPIMAGMPATAGYPGLLAALVIVAVCFAAGLVVRTGPGSRAIDAAQRQVLERVPGYKMLRNLVSRVGGDADIGAFTPAARVHRLDVPLHRLLQVYSKWGEGSGELVAAMRAGSRGSKATA